MLCVYNDIMHVLSHQEMFLVDLVSIVLIVSCYLD